ncbi:syntaxin-2-like [Biomphalaria glabrata]|uniref:Syntaxin-2-like n=1 Tax=Biomphalaria glabrata TaxID=6526 RepID=A0A9U8E8R8_BIOGL|nr:syntaxin-2-like [Biomphalaria glabrata]
MPVRDRLNELHQQLELLEKEKKPGKGSLGKKMEKEKTMQAFLNDASKIESDLVKMKADVAEIKKLQQDMLSTPFQDKANVTKYESLSEQVRMDATKIGTSLKSLEKKYEIQNLSDDSAFTRVRTQQLNTLTTDLNLSTNEFFKIQAEYVDKMKSRLRRQLSAKGEPIDDSKINTIMDENSYSVFTENYITDVSNAEQTLRDLEGRQKDILALEKSITEVNQIFKDMNLLITTQGETLDTIESAIENTTVHVEGGKKELQKAREYQSRARRKKCCIIIIIITVLGILALIIGLSITYG